MDDDLYRAVLIQARRRRALAERPDLGALLAAASAVTTQRPAPVRSTPPPEPEGLAPLPGAKYRRSTPEQIAAFFGQRPSTIPKRG